METLASFWTHDPCGPCDPYDPCGPCDPCDLRGQFPVESTETECPSVPRCSPPAGQMWTEQLSPHVQRNKQLRAVLLQKEAELLHLQDENIRLRRFLRSTKVWNLDHKVQNLSVDRSRRTKRNRTDDEEPVQGGPGPGRWLRPLLVNKRICRNLSADFCSESDSPASEPNLDLWVLRTLGLKDRDTIDPWDQSSPGLRTSGPAPPAAWPLPSCCPTRPTESRSRLHPESTLGSDLIRDFSRDLTRSPDRTQICSIGGGAGPDGSWADRSPLWSDGQNRTRTAPPSRSPSGAPGVDVAFSVALSPSSSIRTQSFPQGQAFVSKGTDGRWTFTWLPRPGP